VKRFSIRRDVSAIADQTTVKSAQIDIPLETESAQAAPKSERPSRVSRSAQAEEATLIENARTDPTAFGELYERYVDRIYAYIYHRVGNTQEAEDLTARTFYRALDRLETYEDRGLPFSAWLFRIAHNLVANWHRDQSRRRFLPLDKLWPDGGKSPELLVELEERHSELWAAIQRLPEDRRNLLMHKFGNRMSNIEIGDLMDKSETAVKSLYFRTLAALRKDLESRGWGRSPSE
jgi:RNA polymerase sigma-70 factor (ECF subfamily)